MGQLERGKAMKISVLKLARNDLKGIYEHLSEFGENPPKKFKESFKNFCDNVSDMPYMFNKYEHIQNYRIAVIVFDYLVFYQVDEKNNTVKIYRILHGKRNAEALIN